ncbi:MAG: hypothetical protein M1510_00985 [Nitrospirae bacterium]|nr:hypothetical protein [Nitrospirota bacterium]MCL5238654.1 hypothetical protein [Nitrospirota bacterium]
MSVVGVVGVIKTAEEALALITAGIDIVRKATEVLQTGDPVSIEEELARLYKAIPRPSGEVVAAADKASGKPPLCASCVQHKADKDCERHPHAEDRGMIYSCPYYAGAFKKE